MKFGSEAGIIAIAGAGIAGLSAAISLKLAGFQPEIFERELELEPVGAGIQLGPNATRILDRWGLALGESFEPEAIELRNARTSALLNSIPLRRAARTRYGAPYVTLLRADLQNALLARARELGIGIRFGAPITTAKESGDKVEAEANGRTFAATALIGADGLFSSVRKFASFPAEPISTGAIAWRAILPLEALPSSLRTGIAVWMSSGAHLVHYPVSCGNSINAVLIIDDDREMEPRTAGIEPLAFLLKRLRDWAALPRSIVSASIEWRPWRIFGLEKWGGGAGHIQLIGDAWHAMRPYLASGAVMAIEDAAALAVSLTASDQIRTALKLFRQSRGPRVWRVADTSARMGRIYHCPPPLDRVRDLAIRMATGSMLLSRNDWLYRPF